MCGILNIVFICKENYTFEIESGGYLKAQYKGTWREFRQGHSCVVIHCDSCAGEEGEGLA